MNPRIKTVEHRNPYKLILTFSNDEVKLFDVQPYLEYPVYQSLKDEVFFNRAHIEYGTVVWNDEIDFDPDTLYMESKSLI